MSIFSGPKFYQHFFALNFVVRRVFDQRVKHSNIVADDLLSTFNAKRLLTSLTKVFHVHQNQVRSCFIMQLSMLKPYAKSHVQYNFMKISSSPETNCRTDWLRANKKKLPTSQNKPDVVYLTEQNRIWIVFSYRRRTRQKTVRYFS